MKKVTMWIAEDGKEFDSEYDCHLYEIKQSLDKMGGCKAFNSLKKLANLDDCEHTYFLHFESLPQIELYEEMEHEQGLCDSIRENGCDSTEPLNFIYFDDDCTIGNGWIQFALLRRLYENKIQSLDEMERDLFGVAAE